MPDAHGGGAFMPKLCSASGGGPNPGSAGQALAMEASDLSVPMVPGIYRRALAALPLKVLALGHQ